MLNKMDVVAKVPLFNGLPPNHLKTLCDISIEKSYSKGQTIFFEGDEADGFYIIAEGTVKIFKMSAEGKEQILHIFKNNEPFGEVPVFTGQTFPANAQVLKKSILLFFPRDTFVGVIEKNPSLSLNMLAVLSMRLKQFTVQIEALSLKEVPGRLASHLIYLAEAQNNRQNVNLEISKGQLASLLGTIPETLSRILNKMSTQKLIEVQGRSIALIDYDAIEELAYEGKLLEG